MEADDHFEQLRAQNRRTELLLLGDDLQQHGAREILGRLVVNHLDFLAGDDQLAQVLKGDVAAGRRVVKATIRVLSYEAFGRHG
jgi:hypothetical protein